MSINHLNIEQATSSIEVVSSSVIDKLYEFAQNPSLDVSSNIQGNLQVTHAYQDAIDYLLNKFPDLHINVTGGAYIRFVDNVVASICATNWGNGTGITTIQASVVTSLNYKFRNNSTIVSFDEFVKFVNVKTLNAGEFQYCSNLQSINGTGSVTYIGAGAFEECTSLKHIDLSSISQVSRFTFSKCTSLLSVQTSSLLTLIDNQAFPYCTSLNNLPNLTNVTSIGYYAFTGCTSLTGNLILPEGLLVLRDCAFQFCKFNTIVIPSTVTNIGAATFEQDGTIAIWVKCLPTTPPTDINRFTFTQGATYPIYVPDASVEAYKEATNWSTYTSRIFPLTQFATDFPNG